MNRTLYETILMAAHRPFEDWSVDTEISEDTYIVKIEMNGHNLIGTATIEDGEIFEICNIEEDLDEQKNVPHEFVNSVYGVICKNCRGLQYRVTPFCKGEK